MFTRTYGQLVWLESNQLFICVRRPVQQDVYNANAMFLETSSAVLRSAEHLLSPVTYTFLYIVNGCLFMGAPWCFHPGKTRSWNILNCFIVVHSAFSTASLIFCYNLFHCCSLLLQVWTSSIRRECHPWAKGLQLLFLWDQLATRSVLTHPAIRPSITMLRSASCSTAC